MAFLYGELTLPSGFAKALSAAIGALGEASAVQMDHNGQLVGLDLELGMAMGANEGSGHQYEVTQYGDQDNGNGHVVPRNVSGLAKPVYRTGGQREDDEGQTEEQDDFLGVLHRFTAFRKCEILL